MRSVFHTKRFIKEFSVFPEAAKEDLLAILSRYLNGERLPRTLFRIFNLDKKTRIQEFKVKDHRGNWRIISCLQHKDHLTLIYAFHKKTQTLSEKDRNTIRKRVLEVQND